MLYEYAIIGIDISQYSLEREIDEYAKKGWRLIQVLHGSHNLLNYQCIFERERAKEEPAWEYRRY